MMDNFEEWHFAPILVKCLLMLSWTKQKDIKKDEERIIANEEKSVDQHHSSE